MLMITETALKSIGKNHFQELPINGTDKNIATLVVIKR